MELQQEEFLRQEYEEAKSILEQMAYPSSANLALDSSSGKEASEQILQEFANRAVPFAEKEWSPEILRLLIESLPDPLVVIDTQGQIVLCNHQTQNLFGYTCKELAGQPIEVLIPQRFREIHSQHRNHYFDDPHPRPMGTGVDLFGLTKNGEEIPVEISLSPLRTEEGLLVSSIIRDITARKREEIKFRSLVERIPAVTFTAPLDANAAELYVSPYIEKMLGFTQKEWIEDPILWYRQLHPDDQERWNENFSPTCAVGQPFQEMYRFIAKDGRIVWIQGSADLVHDAHGKPLFLQGLAFDITSIKEAEQTHLKLASIVASSDDAILGKTLDGTITSWNRGATNIYGYDESETVGQSISMLVPPDREEELGTIMKRIQRGEHIRSFETVRVRKDGVCIDVALTISPIKNAEGTITGASAVARDITKQKRAQAMLQEQANLLALEAAIGVLMTKSLDLPTTLQQCTEALVSHLEAAFARIWIVNHEERVLELRASAGLYVHLDGPHSRVPVGQFKIGQIAQEARPHSTNSVWNDPRVSNKEWARREGMVAFAGYPLIVEERVIGVMALFARHPLSEPTIKALGIIADHVGLGIKRKQTEAELERRVEARTRELARSLEALQEKKEELEQFAHVASHDLTEPLRSIVNYPQKLWNDYRDQLDEKGQRWLERTLDGVRRMRRLIGDVQQYSKVLRSERSSELVDCNTALQCAVDNLEAAITASEAQISSHPLPTVAGYETDLILLFQNLLNNAIKYRSPDRPLQIQLHAERQGGFWQISVEDNAIGIEAKYLPKIFTLGKRLHKESEISGSGFGLSICEKIVRTHNGRIWVESEFGKGSTFFISLPAE